MSCVLLSLRWNYLGDGNKLATALSCPTIDIYLNDIK